MGSNGFPFNANPESCDSVRGFLDFHNGFLTGSNGFLFNAKPESGDSVRGFLDFHNGFLAGANGFLFKANPDSRTSVRGPLHFHNGVLTGSNKFHRSVYTAPSRSSSTFTPDGWSRCVCVSAAGGLEKYYYNWKTTGQSFSNSK